jgi:hypothetical protein
METESREVPSMAVMLVTYSAVTGNVVKNFPRDNFTSLLVYSTVQPGGPVAITGNTCRGSMKLPPRWEPFNNESF